MDNIFLLHCYPAEKKIDIIALHPNWSQVYNKILILLLHFQVIELSCRGKLSGSSCALGNSSYLQLGLKITTKQDRRKAIFLYCTWILWNQSTDTNHNLQHFSKLQIAFCLVTFSKIYFFIAFLSRFFFIFLPLASIQNESETLMKVCVCIFACLKNACRLHFCTKDMFKELLENISGYIQVTCLRLPIPESFSR